MSDERCPTCRSDSPEWDGPLGALARDNDACPDPFHSPVADTDEQLRNFKAKGGAFGPVADGRPLDPTGRPLEADEVADGGEGEPVPTCEHGVYAEGDCSECLTADLAQAHAERDGARADRAVATEDFLRIKAERDEWKREAIHHSELGFAADAANQALRNDLAKAVEGLRAVDVAGAEVGSVSPPEAWQVWRYALTKARSILAEIEESE